VPNESEAGRTALSVGAFCKKKINLLPLLEVDARFPGCSAGNVVAMYSTSTAYFRFHYNDKNASSKKNIGEWSDISVVVSRRLLYVSLCECNIY
jgi:hypothetical protein